MDIRGLLHLLHELVEINKMRVLPRILSRFCNSFMKLNNTGVRMLNFYSLI